MFGTLVIRSLTHQVNFLFVCLLKFTFSKCPTLCLLSHFSRLRNNELLSFSSLIVFYGKKLSTNLSSEKFPLFVCLSFIMSSTWQIFWSPDSKTAWHRPQPQPFIQWNTTTKRDLFIAMLNFLTNWLTIMKEKPRSLNSWCTKEPPRSYRQILSLS